MMQTLVAIVLAATTSSVVIAAQSSDSSPKNATLTTLSGCVDSPNRGRSFTLDD
jgi:hypothetical protein